MKINTKLFNMAVLLIIICFVISACSETDPTEKEALLPDEDKTLLPGQVFIRDADEKDITSAPVGTMLVAFYDGDVPENVSFHWWRNGVTALSIESFYRANTPGRYTVVASSVGYKSITSKEVSVVSTDTSSPGGGIGGGGTGGIPIAPPGPLPLK